MEITKLKGIILIVLIICQSCLIRPEKELCELESDPVFITLICGASILSTPPRRYANESLEVYQQRVERSKNSMRTLCAALLLQHQNCLNKNNGYYLISPI